MSTKQSERDMCRDLAHRCLNQADAGRDDPDSDLCALSRCYLRALEKIERLTEILNHTKPSAGERGERAKGLLARADAELADVWPKAIT